MPSPRRPRISRIVLYGLAAILGQDNLYFNIRVISEGTMTASPVTRTAPPGARAARGARWTVLALLAVAQLMLILDVTVVNVALPDIGVALRLSRDGLPWVMTAYTVCFGGLMLLGGRLADRFGP